MNEQEPGLDHVHVEVHVDVGKEDVHALSALRILARLLWREVASLRSRERTGSMATTNERET